MHGPWHTPVHPDEEDHSAYEQAMEEADFVERVEAHQRPQEEDDVDFERSEP